MKIASILENQKIEKRIAITPEIAKKYISLGLEVSLSENYGSHLGIKDKEYKELGVSILKDEKEIVSNADIIVQLGLLDGDKSSLLKENQTFVGVLNPYDNKDKINDLVKKNINTFSLELLPRITRAQSMDILSSQANLAGYKAVVESIAKFEKAIPMMMTAAGTIPAAKVLVVGAGVAGLQAIATAKRMGAIVFATDVRMASKEQVESLGGKFLTVEGAENLETEGGYAKEAFEIVNVMTDIEIENFIVSDDHYSSEFFMGYPVLMQSDFDSNSCAMVIAIGDSLIRKKIVESLPKDTNYQTIIHPSSRISPFSKIGKGSIISAESVISIDVVIGSHAQINFHSSIGHDCKIGNFLLHVQEQELVVIAK